MSDSIWYHKPGEFREFIKTIRDKSMTVFDALAGFREVKCLPARYKQMTIAELASNSKEIQTLYKALRSGMEAESKLKLPYKRKAREVEIIQDIADAYDIDKEKAKSRVVTGHYNDGDRQFNYAIEIAVAPRKGIDENVKDAGKVDFIGNINDTPSIDGGEGYFSGGDYQWKDPKTGYSLDASSVKEILSECGFNSTDWISKRRVPSVVYLNLKTPVPEWLGAAGKTHINLNPYAKNIAQNLADLAKKMPSYHGKGYAARVITYSTKDPTQEGKNYLVDFLRERRRLVTADPSIKTKRRVTQQGVWYLIEKKMVANGFEPPRSWAKTREYLVDLIPKAIKELWPGGNITREDLGIIAGARAMMHFDGAEYPVSKDNILRLANTKTTDMIIIEKEGIADAVVEYADEYKVALVFTRGRFVNYVKELIKEASARGITNVKIWVVTDYDVDGIEIAKEAPNVPRIGVDRSTIKWLQKNGYPNLKLEDVEESHYTKYAESRTRDSYLWNKRIEIDAILAKVGGEGLWKYLMHQITTKAPIRNYIPIIEKPEMEEVYPEDISQALSDAHDFADAFAEGKWKKIQDEELKEVKGELLKTKEKLDAIKESMTQVLEENRKQIIEKFIEVFTTLAGDKKKSNRRGRTG
jgi:hypothetical protein